MTSTQRGSGTSGLSLDQTAIRQLRAGRRGAVLAPGDAGYEAARRVWNAMIDRRRP